MPVSKERSVRVDLAGGTLDLWPLNLILPRVVTLNVALSLRAQVVVEEIAGPQVVIESRDYDKSYVFTLEQGGETPSLGQLCREQGCLEMDFVCQLLDGVGLRSGVRLTLSSGSPQGAGLGGSSAMGVALSEALSELLQLGWSKAKILSYTQAVEARVLNAGPAGYQDYYPALYGGILALVVDGGEVRVEQLFSLEFKQWLEGHMTLVYSGQARNSGINNWQVYKGFFDQDPTVRQGLEEIARLSHGAYLAIKEGAFSKLPGLLAQEGVHRGELFAGIVPRAVAQLVNSIAALEGFKMCGAGGGGCFILIHSPELKQVVKGQVGAFGMQVLPYQVAPPLI